MLAFRKADWSRFGLAFLSGQMLALSFPKWDFGWLAWFAPGLTLALAAGQPGKRVFILGLFAGMGRYLASLYWLLLIPNKTYAVISWLALSLYLSVYVGAWCWVCWRIAPRKSTRPISKSGRIFWPIFCATAWVAMEMAFTYVLTGFPWPLLGTSQYKFLPLIQIASVMGVYGVGFMVVWVSSALAIGFLEARSSPRPWRLFAENIVVPSMALVAVIGFGLEQLAKTETAGSELKIALIQPSIPQTLIWDERERTNQLNKLLELSHSALAEHPDLLVWPESALPGELARTRATQEMITALVSTNHVWMVFGAEDSGHRKGPNGEDKVEQLTSAFFVNPTGDLVARYHKRHLVVFGEFMPGADWLPFLKKFRDRGGGFARGSRPVPFQMSQPPARLSTLICFEDVFPEMARESVDDDTDILLNLTNNGWFGESAAQWQQAVSALFRAVENGVPLVRCANNGLSCWIDARGRIHETYFSGSQNIYEAGYKIARVPLRGSVTRGQRTIYNRYGDWLGWACVFITVVMTGWSFWSRSSPSPLPPREGRGPG